MPDAQGKPVFSGVCEAHRKVAEVVPATPILECRIAGRKIRCKAESAQPVGAFKLRGAWHRLTALDADQRAAGVVAFSSGNHAQGIAWAAKRLSMPALIVMPSDAPAIKIAGTKALGAEIILYDRKTEDRAAIARGIADDRGAVVVPAYDDAFVIEGQGSAGLEALEQLGWEPDLVVTPCGGGGLAAGLALALPGSRIITAEPEGWDDMRHALAKGGLVSLGSERPSTICDALQPLAPSRLTFDVLHARGATGVAVSDKEVKAAMRFAHAEMGLTIEPGGAAALAALHSGKVEPEERTLVILSGGNVDPVLFAEVMKG